MTTAIIDKLPTKKEIENSKEVSKILSSINGIISKRLREDIFEVKDDQGNDCIVDVEESIVCVYTDICDVPEDEKTKTELFQTLLSINNRAVHGKFAITPRNTIIFRDNLEFENLDENELEASLRWAFGILGESLKIIADILSEFVEELETA